jgi:hypothetical protein
MRDAARILPFPTPLPPLRRAAEVVPIRYRFSVIAAQRLVAGVAVVASLGLGYSLHGAFFLLTGLVGLDLAQSAFSGWSPVVWAFRKFGFPG